MRHGAVTGRLAPSPTGALHLGHALSFVAAYLSARHQGGRLILRFEDLDGDRATQEHIDQAIFDLKWLGLDWDGDPILQSDRTSKIVSSVHSLLKSDLAYPCTCSRGDLARAHSAEEAPGAPQIGVIERPYPGTCDGRYSSLSQAEESGKATGVRFRTPPGPVRFTDAVYGEQVIDVQAEVGDFLIMRRNKTPAYQLAVVRDDALDSVTEVIRGRDLLGSTARQILIAQAIQTPTPKYLHVPLVCDHSGRRLAKREESLGLHDLRAEGVLPEQITAWAIHSLGQATGNPLASLGERALSFRAEGIDREDIRLPRATSELFR